MAAPFPNPLAGTTRGKAGGETSATPELPPAAQLFRQEALRHQQGPLLGNLLSTWPVTFRQITIAATLATAGFIGFVVCAEYTRKVHVAGYLAPTRGFIRVHASQAGTIRERLVEEGQSVRQGDTLFVLTFDRDGATGVRTGQAASNEISRRREAVAGEKLKLVEIARLQLVVHRQRIRDHVEQLAQLDRQVDLQKRRVETFAQSSAQYQTLLDQKFISKNQMQQQAGLQLEQEVALQSLQVGRSSILRDLRAAEQQLPEIALRAENEISQLDRHLSSLDQDRIEADARREQRVSAPIDGIVTAIQGAPGQMVTPAASLLNLLPAGSALEARLLASPAAIGFIRPGKEVRLRYAAFPYQKFGHQRGVVTQVARTVVAATDLPAVSPAQEPYYLVSVALDQQTVKAYGEHLSLHSGMTLDADVLLDRRPIYMWFLEPLFSINGRV